MACTTSFELHHNFPKLAEESGFTFNLHKPRVHIEWNKIKLIDIESLIRERKFMIIEQHINDVLHCVLESEFDVRILDEGVLKIFRLAQLAVEYQQFCRHYLDRSVYIMREEITNLLKELDITKKNLREKEEDIRKLKRKSKQYTRILPNENENIATMLLKTLNQNKGDIFNCTSQTDLLHYNKCNYCEKVFLNQLYLKSHISRRHANMTEIPQRDITEKDTINEAVNSKVNDEIIDLKVKLKEMEDLIKNAQTYNNNTELANSSTVNKKTDVSIILPKEMKDAEVLTSEDGYLQDKIEEWKKQEYDRYNKEINLLRNQIMEVINNKEKEDQSSTVNELKIMDQLQSTIKQQGDEIITLKEELLKGVNSEKEKRKEIETQITYWIKQTEMQSTEYKALLQKLNETTNEAKAYRALVDAEKEKSKTLQELLQQHFKETSLLPTATSEKKKKTEPMKSENEKDVTISKTKNVKPAADLFTLEKLQQKAHDLLYSDQTSADSSSITDEKIETESSPKQLSIDPDIEDYEKNNKQHNIIKSKENKKSRNNEDIENNRSIVKNISKRKSKHKLKPKTENGYAYVPGSPMKVVRAKITEEVNHRLTSLGIDPLKNRLPENIFHKQRLMLQKQQETKTKKFPVREKILHSIMSQLDKNTSSNKAAHVFISPNKSSKKFSISSVFTNVKTKALSLVKSNESSNTSETSYNDVAKRAIALLKTPPGSAHSSPKIQKRHYSPGKDIKQTSKSTKEGKYQHKTVTDSELSEIHQTNNTKYDSESGTLDDDVPLDRLSKTDKEDLIKSPVRHPMDSTIGNQNGFFLNHDKKSSSQIKVMYKPEVEGVNLLKEKENVNKEDSSDGIESIKISPKKSFSEENLSKQTKGVLKNASSTSSLNKKKVLFDMDAIQMKSMSETPSQSITEKSNHNEQFERGIVNLDIEEWDISSIETEPTNNVRITSHTSPKIAELKKTIESQLNRRNPSLSTSLFGGVDVLAAPIKQSTNFGGSNTSLGSSILDESDIMPVQNNTILTKQKTTEKDNSDIELSDLINDAIDNKNKVNYKSF